MCTDDVEWCDPSLPAPAYGVAAIEKVMETLARACPDYEFQQREQAYLSPTHAKAIVRWRCTGTMTGPLEPPGFAPTCQWIEFHGDDHWEFRGDRLCCCETLYDLNALGLQIGAVPAPGSTGERLAVLLQRRAAKRQRKLGELALRHAARHYG